MKIVAVLIDNFFEVLPTNGDLLGIYYVNIKKYFVISSVGIVRLAHNPINWRSHLFFFILDCFPRIFVFLFSDKVC